MYVIPDKRLLFMGEIYTNTGQSLTQKSIEEYKSKYRVFRINFKRIERK